MFKDSFNKITAHFSSQNVLPSSQKGGTSPDNPISNHPFQTDSSQGDNSHPGMLHPDDRLVSALNTSKQAGLLS